MGVQCCKEGLRKEYLFAIKMVYKKVRGWTSMPVLNFVKYKQNVTWQNIHVFNNPP